MEEYDALVKKQSADGNAKMQKWCKLMMLPSKPLDWIAGFAFQEEKGKSL